MLNEKNIFTAVRWFEFYVLWKIVYTVEEAEGLCGKAILKSWRNVENFLQKSWKYGEKVVDRSGGL